MRTHWKARIGLAAAAIVATALLLSAPAQSDTLGQIVITINCEPFVINVDTEWGGGQDALGLYTDATVGDMRASEEPGQAFPASPKRVTHTRALDQTAVVLPDDDNATFRARDGDVFSWSAE